MKDVGSARQIRVLAFVAMLAPMGALPGLVAQAGGGLGWLAPIAAIPLVAAGFFLFRSFGPEGLGETLRARWGRLGRLAAIPYYIWMVALAALAAGQCVDRLGRTDYADLSPWLLSLALAVVAGYLTAGGRGTFLRAAEIFYLILLAALILFGVLGLWGIEPENLAPRSGEEGMGVWKGVIPVLGTMAAGIPAAFFPRAEVSAPRKGWTAVWWCVAAAGICLLVIGTLGGALAAEMPLGFYLALQGVGLPGGFQRMEGLGTAVWVLSDLALIAGAVLAGKAIAGERRWAGWPILLAAAIGGGCLTAEHTATMGSGILWAELALGGGIPLLLAVTPKKFYAKKRG